MVSPPTTLATPSEIKPTAYPSPSEIGSAMMELDKVAHWLGIKLHEVRAGYAVLSMVVRPEMANGHGICHGGLIFTLADTAFAYACNSYNHICLASACSIDFLRPAPLGAVLQATAVEQSRLGRQGVYDVSVHLKNPESSPSGTNDLLIALFRGKSAQIKGTILPMPEDTINSSVK